MGNVVGIDLGTTNSVAAFKFAAVEIVTASDNAPPERTLTRSLVAFHQSNLVVGQEAYNRLRADPENVIVSIKRLMGRGFGDPAVQQQLLRFGYKIAQPMHGTDNSLVVCFGEREYEPEDISALILKKVVENAQTFQNEKGQTSTITEAVITIPAYFNDKQRHATRAAAFRAGLTPRELLPEPTAAAISYGFTPDGANDAKTILVYDFGGGTFDASLITASGNWFTELGKAGDLWLGGDDIDQALVQFVKKQVAYQEGLDDIDGAIAKMPDFQQLRFLADLKIAVERAKIALSNTASVRIIPATPLLDELGMPIYIDVELTGEHFEQLIAPIVERTIAISRDAIKYSDYPEDMVDAVLLVGGSSQIPLVQRLVREAFGADKVVVHPRPMYAVAEGAAIVAAGLTEKVGTVSRDYYIKLIDGLYKVISRGEMLPFSTSQTFKTVAEGQRLIRFEFFNRDDETQVNEPIGEMWLGLHKPYPKGTEVLVTLELNEQMGNLQISAFLKNDPSVKVSSSFSRGRADEKIYREVYEIVQDLNQRGLSAERIEQVSQWVVPIVQRTNQIIDYQTGRERDDLRQQAWEELETLKRDVSQDRNTADSLANECEFLAKTYGFLIPAAQQLRLLSYSQQLSEALRKNNLSAMQALSEEARREVANLPESVQKIRYSRYAIYLATLKDPIQGNAMNDKLLRMTKAQERQDGEEAERIWHELWTDVRYWLDREPPTAIIPTDLSR